MKTAYTPEPYSSRLQKPKGEQTRQVCATRVGNPKRKYTHRIYTKYIYINIHTRNNAESTHEYTHVQTTYPHILTRDISRKQKGRQPETSRTPFLFQRIGASPWCHSPSPHFHFHMAHLPSTICIQIAPTDRVPKCGHEHLHATSRNQICHETDHQPDWNDSAPC